MNMIGRYTGKMKMKNISRTSALMLLTVLTACQSNGSSSSLGVLDSGNKEVKICSGFGCIYSAQLAFSGADLKHINSVLKTDFATPADERKSLADLIAWKERLAQSKLRMVTDTRLSYQRDAGKVGQMDCVDESSNTLAFIQFLDRNGLLKFNKPTRIVGRGFLFDGRYPHRTAVVRDIKGKDWAIDSWKKDGGKLPQVVELAVWKKERGSEYR